MMDFPAWSKRDIDIQSAKILTSFQPKVLTALEPLNVDRLIEVVEDALEIDFDITYDLPHGIEGCTSTTDNKVLIHADLADDPSSVKRFRATVAHEIGHALLHVPLLREYSRNRIFSQKKGEEKGIELYRNANCPAYKDPEWQAWYFAGAILMPKPAIDMLLKSGDSLRSMAERFEVNPAFLKVRLRKLEVDIENIGQ
jgi:Zn-dependent peptidase ImmA (M78 family)